MLREWADNDDANKDPISERLVPSQPEAEASPSDHETSTTVKESKASPRGSSPLINIENIDCDCGDIDDINGTLY